MSEDIKKAELRGYSRGYVAGRRKRKQEMAREHMRKERQAFLDKAFLAALAPMLTAQGWKMDDKPVNTTADRVELAWRIASTALKNRRFTS